MKSSSAELNRRPRGMPTAALKSAWISERRISNRLFAGAVALPVHDLVIQEFDYKKSLRMQVRAIGDVCQKLVQHQGTRLKSARTGDQFLITVELKPRDDRGCWNDLKPRLLELTPCPMDVDRV